MVLDIINLLKTNQEWLFSGIGVVGVSWISRTIYHWFHKQNYTEPKQKQITGDNCVNFQSGAGITINNSHLVDESKNWNRITYISSRLEKFYGPLSQRLGDYYRTGNSDCIDNFNALLNETSSFLHFAISEDVKKAFTTLRAYQRHPMKGQNELDNVDILRDNLLCLVNRDIEKLERELEELTKDSLRNNLGNT